MRATVIASLCVASAIVTAAACTTDYQEGKGDVAYGAPNALAGQRPPGATSDVTAEGGDTTNVVVAPGTTPVCVKAGMTQVEAGTCAVSFAKDVLGAFGTAGCSDPNCHGGTTPRNEPRIEQSDPTAMWPELQAFTLSTGKPYFDPCSTNEADSQMSCNFLATGACGQHMPSTGQLPQADLDKIIAWLKCGSPNN